jgi:Rrf2 family protein
MSIDIQENGHLVQVSERANYAIRAVLEIAARAPAWVTMDTIVSAQQFPRPYIESILAELRRAGVVVSRRGPNGGYLLTRAAEEVTIGSLVRRIDGPTIQLHAFDMRFDEEPAGAAAHLPAVWNALRTCIDDVLDSTTLQHVLDGDVHLLPGETDRDG